MFAREDGTPMRPKNVNRTVNWAIEGAGVTRVTPHGLRDSAASILLDQGAPIPAVSAILGPSSPAITMSVYAHMLEGSDRRSIDALGTAVFGHREALETFRPSQVPGRSARAVVDATAVRRRDLLPSDTS